MSFRSKLRIRSRLRSIVHRVFPPAPKPLILAYHRIANVSNDPWGLSVSPTHFEQQLQVLRRTRRPFPLAGFVRNLMAGTLPPDAVAVTFDDGYADNLEAAKPRLVAADVPATVFVTTGYLSRPDEFWWDELSRLILVGRGPGNFQLSIGGQAINVDRGANIDESDDSLSPTTELTTRQFTLTTLWQAIRRLDDDEQRSIMTEIRSILSTSPGDFDRGRAMTCEEVRTLASDELVTIGAHTVTHPLLTTLTDATCLREVVESKARCEEVIGKPVTGFAYPYGGFNSNVRQMVSSTGFSFACSTQHTEASKKSDVLALPRIHIFNWDGNAFEEALRRY